MTGARAQRKRGRVHASSGRGSSKTTGRRATKGLCGRTEGRLRMKRQSTDKWDDYGCVSENQAMAKQVAQALEQDAGGNTKNTPPNSQQAEQPFSVEEEMPVAPVRD